MIQEVVRDCRHDTGGGQRLQIYYKRWLEAVEIIEGNVRDCRHDTGDSQRLQT
ncbi:unnamed protein product [Staurois parvus]|uniref:Uncharacterized protein n=1 Tax=Staurois parvus TaxID=386267 RepID=A0ABN9DTU4_9NEOB|nr:unnamed protein product [Staurois parvus]